MTHLRRFGVLLAHLTHVLFGIMLLVALGIIPGVWMNITIGVGAGWEALMSLVLVMYAWGAVVGVSHYLQPGPTFWFSMHLRAIEALFMVIMLLIAMPGFGPFLFVVVPPLAYFVASWIHMEPTCNEMAKSAAA